MCAVPVTMDVVIDEEMVFYIPNSFTPDQDEHNQTWDLSLHKVLTPIILNLKYTIAGEN